jgi:hypothetical protein
VGDLCEIGNGSILMPGTRLGDRVFLGEGTVVPTGMTLPSDVVAVGRPARFVRTASADDLARLLALRDGDLSIPPLSTITVKETQETIAVGQLHEYRGIGPTVAASAIVFPTTEITGDVVVGERSRFAAATDIDGFPAIDVGRLPALPATPTWALRHDDLPVSTPTRGPTE